MNETPVNTVLVRKVLNHVLQTYSDNSDSAEDTSRSLNEALDSLKPFTPPADDIKAINSVLMQKSASDLACKAAWALYKDYVVNDKKRAQQA